jgi:hypothetical protein
MPTRIIWGKPGDGKLESLLTFLCFPRERDASRTPEMICEDLNFKKHWTDRHTKSTKYSASQSGVFSFLP